MPLPVPVSVHWVTAPHEPTLEQLEQGVRTGVGAVLIGPAGVGKTTLAREAAERLGADFARSTGFARLRRGRPFRSRRSSGCSTSPSWARPPSVLRAARESLGDGRLLVVDDAHLLDSLSAALVYQLAVSRAVRMLVTATVDRARMPPEIAALWRDGLLTRIDLSPPGHDDSRLRCAGRRVRRTPCLRHRTGYWSTWPSPTRCPWPTRWRWPVPTRSTRRCAPGRLSWTTTDCARRIRCSSTRCAARSADRTFAGCAPRWWSGSRHQAVTVSWGGCAGPSWRSAATVRNRCPTLAPPPRKRCGWGIWSSANGSDRPHSAREPDLATRLTVGYALAWQGRGREADAVLADIDPAALTEDELMAWALPTAANQFWMLSEPERATAFLRSTRGKVSSPAALTTLDALSATFTMNAGNLSRAKDIADEVLASPTADDTAIGWAASAAALSSARMGRFDDVDALAEQALSAGQPGLLRFTSGFGQTTALLMTGDPERALALAQRLTDFAQRQQPGRADRRGSGGRRADRHRRTAPRGAAAARCGDDVGSDGVFVGAAGVDAAGAGAGPARRAGRGGKSVGTRRIPARTEVDAVCTGAGAGQSVDDGVAR